MDAVPALTLSLVGLFPGLMLYCAIYDVFCRRNNAVSTVPRDPKSVEALTVIVLGSIAVHGVALLALDAITWPCWFGVCGRLTPLPAQSGEALLLAMSAGAKPAASSLEIVAATTLALGLLTYGVANGTMIRLAKAEKLPFWLYRWTSTVAVSADRERTVMVAYVVTKLEQGTKRVAYIGPVDDLALDDKFDVQRLVLVQCDRFVFNPAQAGSAAFGASLGTLSKLVLHAAAIENVSFERLDLAA